MLESLSQINYVCSKCGSTNPVTTLEPLCSCGGLWQLDFKTPAFSMDLVDPQEWSLFRYRNFLPIVGDDWKRITLGEGRTPIIKLNEDVLLKMDYFMPTLSFKDRGAALLMTHCKTIGVTSVLQDSSGNAGNSVAAYSARAGIKCEIYVPEGTSAAKIKMIESHNAKVHVIPGGRDVCAEACRNRVINNHEYYASHVFNPFFFEGTKTYIYEVYEQLGRIPENLFIPLGNGTLFIGIIKALEELHRCGILEQMPRIFAVQSEYCAPIFQAWKSNKTKPETIIAKETLAEGVAVGVPLRGEEILQYIYKYDVVMLTSPEDRILDARKELAHKGIFCEHTSAATYAAYQEFVETVGPLHDCLIPMCGAGLKSEK